MTKSVTRVDQLDQKWSPAKASGAICWCDQLGKQKKKVLRLHVLCPYCGVVHRHSHVIHHQGSTEIGSTEIRISLCDPEFGGPKKYEVKIISESDFLKLEQSK